MKAYHFFKVNKLDIDIDRPISTIQQKALIGDNAPKSVLSLTKRGFYREFDKLKFEYETKKNVTGRAYGNDDYFNSCVVHESFDGYYNEKKNLLLIQASKVLVNGFIRNVNRYCSKCFSVERFDVNFVQVVERTQNVRGSWINGLPDTNVRSIGLFGDHVNLSDDYDRHKAVGNLSALYVDLLLEKKQYSFTITKQFVVVIYTNQSIEEDLDFLNGLTYLILDDVQDYKPEELSS